MARTILSKVAQLLLVLLGISLLTFFLLSALPGNAADYRIGPLPNFTPAQRAAIVARLTRQLGLNRPLPVQFVIWLWHALRGDFGYTSEGQSVTQLVGSRVVASLELALAGLIPSILAAVLLATWAFRTRLRRVQAVVQALMSAIFVIPSFWLAFLLVLWLAVKQPLFPASGYVSFGSDPAENIRHLILPALTLACPLTALFFRYLLAGLEEAALGAYVTAARAKGITERALAYRHVLPNGMLPTITIVGMAAASLLSSLVIVESVFSWPGLGSLLVQSVTARDYNTLVAIVLLTATAFVVTSLLVDVVYWLVDPRRHAPPGGELSVAAADLSALAQAGRTGPSPLAGVLKTLLALPRSLIAGAAILAPFVYIAVLPGTVAPYSPYTTVGVPLASPSSADLLGTDEIGRDVLSRVIWGTQSDVLVSLAATALAFLVGSIVGVAIGYRGGLVDTSASRVIDILLAFPAIVLALFLIAIFGHGEFVEIAAIATVMAPSMARFARSTSLLLRHRAFVESSQILHASAWHIMRRHLLPNALRTMLVAASVLGASAVLIAASLSYLGLGAQPPTASWGEMLYNAFNNVFQAPLYGVVPGACITVLAYGYLLLARGLGELHGRTGRHSASEFRSSVTRV